MPLSDWYARGPPLYLYRPLGCQEGSRLGGWCHRWPLSHNPQSETQQVAKSRGQLCGDFALAGYLANVAGSVPLVLDLRIAHDRWGNSSDPSINGHLRYPNDIDGSLNEAAADKMRKYRADYNNNPPNAISFMPAIASTSGRIHIEFVRHLFLQADRETDCFFEASGVQLAQHKCGQFHYRRAAFSSQLKSKIGNILAVPILRCSSPPHNTVYSRRVDHISLYLALALLFHNKQHVFF